MSNRLPPSQLIAGGSVTHMIRRPGHLMHPQGLVFPKLEKFVRRHLAKLMSSTSMEAAELFAVVDGSRGGGKTVGVTDGCSRAGYASLTIPASHLAGESEGTASANLTRILTDAVAWSQSTGDRVAALIDDAHQSIFGSTDRVISKTINSGLITNELQRIADHKPYRSACGTPIPIFFLGNNFKETASSLFRDRRANHFTHTPDFEEKIHLVFHMYAPRSREELRLVEALVRHYKRQPIAYFAALRMDLMSAHLDEAIPDGPLDKATIDASWPKRLPLDPDRVWALAKTRAADAFVDFN